MKIAIVFDSHTGNTKKVANVIKEACINEEVVYFGEPQTFSDADLIFIGSWTDKGNCSQRFKIFLLLFQMKKSLFLQQLDLVVLLNTMINWQNDLIML